MLAGVLGSLVSEHFLEDDLPRLFAGELGEATRERASAEIRRWWDRVAATLGPASALRAVVDVAARPLLRILGFEADERATLADLAATAIVLRSDAGAPVMLLVAAWGADLDALWHAAVRLGASAQTTWCLCFNATHLRLVDSQRTFARRFLEINLATATVHPDTLAALWALFRADAYGTLRPSAPAPAHGQPPQPLIDRIVAQSDQRAVTVCASLRRGVFDAVIELVRAFVSATGRSCGSRPDRARLADTLDQSLTVVYRILFLLYAEARGLLPVWHPIYKDSYAIETLRSIAERPEEAVGLWETIQAMSRLARAGCEAGSLRVTAFNGRLFSPRQAPLAERTALDDETVRKAIVALSSEPGRQGTGRRRIAYRDLGVEQLGSVYESVLDYEPHVSTALATRANAFAAAPTGHAISGGMSNGPARPTSTALLVRLDPGGGRRKATGTFYTPRPITEYLVRRALDPLVAGASADAILRLRVLDPSMGSGAFLVAACRHLASVYESALVREGGCQPGDIGEAERCTFRRTIAERCLYGVDLNPMAVQLARLSLWLTTLAADRPLTFLDHALRTGDSLIGASLDDLARQAPGPIRARASTTGPAPLPLFDVDDLHASLREVLPVRSRLAMTPSHSVRDVRAKEADLARIGSARGALSRWKAAADLWCACWFWDEDQVRPDKRVYADLASSLLRAAGTLPDRSGRPFLDAARRIAARRRVFHWTLEFPEVFFDDSGRPLANAGFDAVVGNPPWEMLRSDDPGDGAGRLAPRRLVSFARESGTYTASGTGHVNLFQLFLERALRLTRRGGRVGLVLPWGLASDQGCAALRRALFDKADTDALVGFENVDAVFPIHRSVRFLALTATPGSRTERVRCRFGERDPHALDRIPSSASDMTTAHFPITLTPALIRRLSGDDLAIPDLRSTADLALVERLSARFPRLGSSSGWAAEFSRELNASDDRRHLHPGPGALPVVEGKHVSPFRVNLRGCTHHIVERDAARLLEPGRTFRRARLAYRDVASATNRLTLIAAIVPPGCVTTHTLFCLRTRLDDASQAFLCGVLNSFVANYLVRQRVTTHLSTAIVGLVPAPRPDPFEPAFREAAELSVALAGVDCPEHEAAYARLQALIATAYGLAPEELVRVLGSFPLVEISIREATYEAFLAISR